MSLDAHVTVAALNAARAMFREQIAWHGGRVIDMAGDSALAVFGTAAGAVDAPLVVQAALKFGPAECFDLALLYGVGVVGFLMRRYEIPVAPVLVGMILGPLAEQQFRRALAISQGDLTIFFTQPISAGVFAITAAVLIVPPLVTRLRKARA